MHILITGASGFIGQELTCALLSLPSVTQLTLTDVVKPSPPQPTAKHSHNVHVSCVEADLTSRHVCEELLTADINVSYLLHGIMSGTAEANLELGLRVNFDSTRQILDILRAVRPGAKIVYPSSCAVFGPPGPGEVVTERTMPRPGTSYGAQKLMCEILLNDFSRRDLLDARILRLPTVMVRPGKPSGAASGFASGIFREPLKGERTVLPVDKHLEIWICSPQTVVGNMIRAMEIPKEKFGAGSRVVILPGITVTVADMLEALRTVGGEQALGLVEERKDETIERIVTEWPARFDTTRAKLLGLAADGSLVDTVRAYVQEYGEKKS